MTRFAIGLSLILVSAVLIFATPGRADLQGGIAAYRDQRFEAAYKQLLPLADAGNAEAQFYVGRMLEFGQGQNVDGWKGLQYYVDAAAQGYAPARVAAGDHFYATSKKFDGKLHREQIFGFYLRAAIQGYPEAYLRLSTLFCEGISAPWRPIQAEAWYALYSEINGPSTWETLIKENRFTPHCLVEETNIDLAGTLTAMMADKLREVYDLPSPAESRARFRD